LYLTGSNTYIGNKGRVSKVDSRRIRFSPSEVIIRGLHHGTTVPAKPKGNSFVVRVARLQSQLRRVPRQLLVGKYADTKTQSVNT
jgi:hypothetical protein